MSRRASSFLSAAAATLALAFPARAWGQACCAGSSALTPGRLSIHDDALVGLQLRAAGVMGAYDPYGHYAAERAGSQEADLEQDVFGAVRVLRHGQVALLVPFVETRRAAPGSGSEAGGGIGDVNLSARWDFTWAGASRVVPGIALLAGATAPTGTPPESASNPLATDATGIGAAQASFGLALEQTFGPWLVNATMLVAGRLPRTANGVHETLGTQITFLAAGAYAFRNEAAIALASSYAFEGDATIDGAVDHGSARRALVVSVSFVYPITDAWRLQGSIFLDPPFSMPLGENQPATVGTTLAILWSFS
jgi:hypothetical protein